MTDHDERAQVLAAIEAAQRALDAARALMAGAATVSASESPDWRTLKAAAHECGVHVETMSRWCRIHGLGRRIDGGTWRVDMRRVRAWQEGQPYTRLMSEEVGGNGNDPDAAADASASQSVPEGAAK